MVRRAYIGTVPAPPIGTTWKGRCKNAKDPLKRAEACAYANQIEAEKGNNEVPGSVTPPAVYESAPPGDTRQSRGRAQTIPVAPILLGSGAILAFLGLVWWGTR